MLAFGLDAKHLISSDMMSGMIRRHFILGLICALAFSVGCSQADPPLEEVVPAQLNGWNRTQMKTIAVADAPEIIRQLGLKRAAAATYTGPATINVRLFEMNAPTSAFELIQKWRQQDGLAVYNGRFFITAEPNSPTGAAPLLEQLRKAVK
jgi:hypothetical protein